MEVASPLALAPGTAGTKRSLVCSPGLMDTTNSGIFSSTNAMDLTEDGLHRSFKRRRFATDTAMENLPENNSTISPFRTSSFHHAKSIFSQNNGQSYKRCRTDALSPGQNQTNELNRVVEAQASEIANLKTAKSNLEATLAEFKGEHEKVLHENKILKRAVTIQQERQSQAAKDLEGARQFKSSAEDQIRRLEQMIINLRYHLQAQQPTMGNDFMGFPPQPPDVY